MTPEMKEGPLGLAGLVRSFRQRPSAVEVAFCKDQIARAEKAARKTRADEADRKFIADLRSEGSALRYDDGKSRVDLIDPNFILALGDHYQRGAKKYAERNWEKGMLFSRCYASAQRHLLAFWSGEDTDAETGTLHVVAVAWNMAAIHHYMNDPALREKFDDRPRKGLEKPVPFV